MSRLEKVAFLALLASTHVSAQDVRAYELWKGCYESFVFAGRTVGGSAITRNHILRISPPDICTLAREGFQVSDVLFCTLAGNGPRLQVRFSTYENGGSLNEYGVAGFKKDENLFELARDPGKSRRLLTFWDALVPDGVEQKSGEYFSACVR